MFFEFSLTIPANTPAAAPVSLDIELALGEVTWWEIQFPAGCNGLVHVYVTDETHPVIPTNTDGDVAGSGANISPFDAISLETEPATLRLFGWNTDDTFPHTITFRFSVRSSAELARINSAFRALDYLDRWFSQQQPQPPA